MTIIYFMKNQSQNTYLKNNPPPPPPWRLNGGPLSIDLSLRHRLYNVIFEAVARVHHLMILHRKKMNILNTSSGIQDISSFCIGRERTTTRSAYSTT